MSRKWLQQEGPQWVEKGIITEAQFGEITALYPEQERAIGIFPLLASLLIGLGVLSFIASNWEGIPHLGRLFLIFAFLIGFYVTGYRLLARPGADKVGIGLIGMGLLTFGAGIFLIGQMFHLTATNVGSFIIWGLAGVGLTYLFKSRYLFLLSSVILSIAQFYSIDKFHTFSYVSFVVLVFGLGAYWQFNRHWLLSWVISASAVLQGIALLMHLDYHPLWIIVPAIAVYMIGDWLKERHLQYFPLVFAYGFSVIMSYFGELITDTEREGIHASTLLTVSLVMLALSLLGKYRTGTLKSGWEWILFLPAMFAASHPVFFAPAMLIFSLYILLDGYAKEWRGKVNIGTGLFLLSTLVGYTRLAWDFMDKSLFFLIGGVLLFGLHLFLQKRKRDVFGGDGK